MRWWSRQPPEPEGFIFMTIEITKEEQEILHLALMHYLEVVVKATNELYQLGAVIENPPAMAIKAVHSKIVSV